MSEIAPQPSMARRILVIEDEAAVCDLVGEALADDGFEPVCVQTDKQAYRALRHDAGFACMLVDVNLGQGTTGYDVARYARRIAPQVPVIYLSGQTSEASFRTNGVAGSLLLPKPFTPAELLERVRMLVGDNDDSPATRRS